MPSALSKISYKVIGKIPPEWILFYLKLSKLQKLGIIGSIAGFFTFLRKLHVQKRRQRARRHNSSVPRPRLPGVNLQFFKEMKFLLKLMIPNVWSKQIGLLITHTGTLIARTFLSIYVAKLEGKIVKEIVQK